MPRWIAVGSRRSSSLLASVLAIQLGGHAGHPGLIEIGAGRPVRAALFANAGETGLDLWMDVNVWVKPYRLLGVVLAILLVGQSLTLRPFQQGIDPPPQGLVLFSGRLHERQGVQGTVEQGQPIDAGPLRSAEQQMEHARRLIRVVPLAVPVTLRIRPAPGVDRP